MANDTKDYTKKCLREVAIKLQELIDLIESEGSWRLADNDNHIQIPASVTAVKLIDANINRREVAITNNGNQTLYIKKGAGVTLTNWSYLLKRGDLVNIDDYRGEIWAVWNVANGNAEIAETY